MDNDNFRSNNSSTENSSTENFTSIENCPFHGQLAPTKKGLPLLGNVMDLRKRPLDVLIDGAAENGSVFRLKALGKNIHVVSGQTAIDLILENDETRIHRKNLFDAFSTETDVDIFGVMGERHQTLRNLVRPGLARNIISQFVPEMVSRLTQSLDAWPEKIKGLDRICHATCEAIATALTPDPMSEPLQVFADFGIRVMMVLVRQWPKSLFLLPTHRRQKRKVQAALEKAIELHRSGHYQTLPKTYIFDAFLQSEFDGNKMTDRDIRGMGMYTLSGTYIYCGRTATFMVYEILKNPRLLAEVLPEIDAAFDGEGLTADILRKMTYLRATFVESLRRYPLLPGLPYRAARDLVIDGYQVPKDDILLLTGVPEHYLYNNYDNPFSFDPKRCMAPRNEHRNQSAYSPWGFRPRTCAAIGLNEIVIMVTVATILRNLHLKLLRPSYEIELEIRPLICPKDDLPLEVLGRRTPEEYLANRNYLSGRQVEEEQLTESLYEFELPDLEPEIVSSGNDVVTQGEPAQHFYMIIEGTATVIKTIDGQSKVVNQLAAGDSFGEIGLLKGIARTATVRAETDLKLLRLSRNDFLRLTTDSDLLPSELSFIIQKQFIQQSLLRSMPSLDAEAFSKISSEFEMVYFEEGAIVFEEGEASDAIYIIVTGDFEVVRDLGDDETILKHCGAGEIVGEIGVLQRKPRMASIRNSKNAPGAMAKLTRDRVEAMLDASGQAQSELALLVSKRLMEDIELI